MQKIAYEDILSDVSRENSIALVLYNDEKDGDKNEYFDKELNRIKIPPVTDRKVLSLAENEPMLKDEFAVALFGETSAYYMRRKVDPISEFELIYYPKPEYIFFNRKREEFDYLFVTIARGFLLDKKVDKKIIFMDDENNPEIWGRDEFLEFFLQNRGKLFQENGSKKYSSTKNYPGAISEMVTGKSAGVKVVLNITKTILESGLEEPALYIVEDLSEIKNLDRCLRKLIFTGSVLHIKHHNHYLTLVEDCENREEYGIPEACHYVPQLEDILILRNEAKELFPPDDLR